MIKDLEKHWRNNMHDPIANIKTPSNWSDFSLKFSLNLLHEKFYDFFLLKKSNEINFNREIKW
jgi:hypothetical protein